jgi:hypothetical protein
MSKQILLMKKEFINKVVQMFNVKFENLEEQYLGKIYGMSNFLKYKSLVVKALGKFKGLPVSILSDNMQAARPQQADSIIYFLINWGSKGLLDILTDFLSEEQFSLARCSNDSQSHDLENRI